MTLPQMVHAAWYTTSRRRALSWAVVLTVPAHRAQQLALQIAVPLLGIILILSVLFVIVLRLGLRVVTGSLQTLSLEAGRISQGQLDHKLPVEGEDEVGRLRRAFEQMRTSLKARLDELNRLLVVSRGVASNLEMKEAVKPILESALAAGGCAAAWCCRHRGPRPGWRLGDASQL